MTMPRKPVAAVIGVVLLASIWLAVGSSQEVGARHPRPGDTAQTPPPPIDLRQTRRVAVADSHGNVLRRPDGSIVMVTVGGVVPPPVTPIDLPRGAVAMRPSVSISQAAGEVHVVQSVSDAEKIRRIDELERFRARE